MTDQIYVFYYIRDSYEFMKSRIFPDIRIFRYYQSLMSILTNYQSLTSTLTNQQSLTIKKAEKGGPDKVRSRLEYEAVTISASGYI